MSTKHTPGPWASLPEECGKDYIRIRGTNLGLRYKIANVITPVYAGATDRELEETRANARLIAAAPKLEEALEALKSAIGKMPADTKSPGWGEVVAALFMSEEALNAARGEQ